MALEEKEKVGAETGVLSSLRNGPTLALSVCKFLDLSCSIGVVLWLPQIIASLGHMTMLQVSFANGVPFLLAAGIAILVARHSDRTQRAHLARRGAGVRRRARLPYAWRLTRQPGRRRHRHLHRHHRLLDLERCRLDPFAEIPFGRGSGIRPCAGQLRRQSRRLLRPVRHRMAQANLRGLSPVARIPGRYPGRQRPDCRRAAVLRPAPAAPLAADAIGLARDFQKLNDHLQEEPFMSIDLGTGEYGYRVVENWAKLPDGAGRGRCFGYRHRRAATACTCSIAASIRWSCWSRTAPSSALGRGTVPAPPWPARRPRRLALLHG